MGFVSGGCNTPFFALASQITDLILSQEVTIHFLVTASKETHLALAWWRFIVPQSASAWTSVRSSVCQFHFPSENVNKAVSEYNSISECYTVQRTVNTSLDRTCIALAQYGFVVRIISSCKLVKVCFWLTFFFFYFYLFTLITWLGNNFEYPLSSYPMTVVPEVHRWTLFDNSKRRRIWLNYPCSKE